jgi:hypothetical protein
MIVGLLDSVTVPEDNERMVALWVTRRPPELVAGAAEPDDPVTYT